MTTIYATGQKTIFDMNDVITANNANKPQNPVDGTLWFNIDDNKLYVYVASLSIWKFASDGLVIGGKNLILNSDTTYTKTIYLINQYTLSENFVAGDEYTFVINGSVTSGQKFGIWQNNGSSNVGYATSVYRNGTFYVTFKAVATTSGYENKLNLYNYPSGTTTSTVNWVALYKGNVPMDWTPAPEDTEAVITTINTTLGNMVNDNVIDVSERQTLKDKINEIIGYSISTTTLPSTITLDASNKGSFWSTRTSAINAGIPTSDATFVSLATAWDGTGGLKPYLEGLTSSPIGVKLWDVSDANKNFLFTTDGTGNGTKDNFRTKWLNYYNAELNLANLTAQKLKQNADNINVGGQNLILNSSFNFVDETDVLTIWSNIDTKWVRKNPENDQPNHSIITASATGNTINQIYSAYSNTFDAKNGDIFMFTIDLKVTNMTNWDVKAPFLVEFLDASGTRVQYKDVYVSDFLNSPTISDGTWNRVSYMATVTTGTVTKGRIRLTLFKNGEIFIRRIKVERGNRVTDYSSAEYDLNNSIDIITSTVSDIQTIIGEKGEGIITRITNSRTYQDDLGSKADTSKLSDYATNTELGVVKNSIDPKIAQAIIELKLGSTYATLHDLENTSTNLTNKFSASGGMNLLKNSIGYSDIITKSVADTGTKKNWFVQGVSSRFKRNQNNELDILGFGSGFQFSSVIDTPTSLPTLILEANASSTLTVATYYVKYTWVTSTGESLPSPEKSLAVTTGNNLKITIPSFPTNVTQAKIYVGTSSNANKYQNVISTSGGSLILSSPISTSVSISISRDTSLDQYVNVIAGLTYTLSWYIKKTNTSPSTDETGSFKIFLYEYGTTNKINLNWKEDDGTGNLVDKTGTEYKYNSERTTTGFEPMNVSFTPTTNKVQLRLYGFGLANVTITGLMFTIGDVPLQWSLATGENYNTNVRMDINGIRVSQINTLADGTKKEVGYTQITPDEFAGYYDANSDGTFEKVFYLKEDKTVSKNFEAQDEFSLGTIKIIKVEGTNNTGWAFVPNN